LLRKGPRAVPVASIHASVSIALDMHKPRFPP